MERSKIRFLVRIATPVLLLVVVFRWVDWDRFFSVLAQADYALMGVGFALYLGAVFLQGWRWHILLSADGIGKPFLLFQTVNYAANFFDLFTPGKLGSDVYRVVCFRTEVRVHDMISALCTLRLQGLLFNLALVAITAVYYFRWIGIALLALVLIGVSLLIVPVGLLRRVSDGLRVRWRGKSKGGFMADQVCDHLAALLNAFQVLQRNRTTMVSTTVLAGVATLLSILIYMVIGQAFHMKLEFTGYLLVVPLLTVASVLPVTIHGRGVTEALALFFWLGPDASVEQILLTCLAVYVVVLGHGLLGGLVWIGVHPYIAEFSVARKSN